MKEKLTELCRNAISGKISFDDFYDRLGEIAEDSRTDDDTACIIEDVLMELEMLHDEGASKKELKAAAAENAERIISEIGE